MIIGTGIDLVDIPRVSRILASHSAERFMCRILTPAERQLASIRQGRRLAEFVAGRFAAKEAIVKALGCGIGAIAGFQDVEVTPDTAGKPQCVLSDPAIRRLNMSDKQLAIHLSITHSTVLAAAYAIVEQIK